MSKPKVKKKGEVESLLVSPKKFEEYDKGSMPEKRDDPFVMNHEARKTTDSTYDRIYKYYHVNNTRIVLTEKENAVRERLEKAWYLLARHRVRKTVVDLICKLFNVEKSIAYDDVRKAMDLFGNPQEDSKQAKRAIAETMLMRGADKAWKDGQLDLYHKFIKSYNELNGLNNENSDTTLADLLKKLKPQTIVIVANHSDLENEARMLLEEVKDIAHEEVP